MGKNNRHGQAEILSASDCDRIRRSIISKHHLLFWDIARYTGERWGAICQLKVSDVYQDAIASEPHDEITFRKATRKASPSGKQETRQCPVHPELSRLLKAYKPENSGYLFPSNGFGSPHITDLQKQLHQTECELDKLLALPEFEKYLAVFKKFGFGTRMSSLLMFQCYPLDKFLLDGKVWVEYEIGKSKEGIPKEQKRHKSLRSFQLYLGYGYTKQQSGDGLKMSLGGSDICRSHLFIWTNSCVIPARNDTKWLNKKLNETKSAAKHNTLQSIKDSDQKLKQKINRLNFQPTFRS
jgi:hypothetical protein